MLTKIIFSDRHQRVLKENGPNASDAQKKVDLLDKIKILFETDAGHKIKALSALTNILVDINGDNVPVLWIKLNINPIEKGIVEENLQAIYNFLKQALTKENLNYKPVPITDSPDSSNYWGIYLVER